MVNTFEPIDNEDTVLSISDSNARVFISHPMFKLAELLKKMKSQVIGIDSSYWEGEQHYIEKKRWHSQGVRCKILKPGGYWKKGKIKIRISLEFCPDEPESPLDDIRQTLKQAEIS